MASQQPHALALSVSHERIRFSADGLGRGASTPFVKMPGGNQAIGFGE